MTIFRNIFSRTSKANTEEPKQTLFKTHRDKIYPWVKVVFGDDDPRNTTVQIELTGEDSPVNRAWLGDLAIFYVADMGDNFQVLLKRDLPHHISEEQLHQIAMENLNRDVEFRLQETNYGGYMLIAGGNHEAGAICLPGMWQWLTDHLGQSLLVAIPAKDLVLIVPENDADGLANLKIFVHEIHKNGDRLLTENLFKYDKGTQEWTIADSIRENASR